MVKHSQYFGRSEQGKDALACVPKALQWTQSQPSTCEDPHPTKYYADSANAKPYKHTQPSPIIRLVINNSNSSQGVLNKIKGRRKNPTAFLAAFDLFARLFVS